MVQEVIDARLRNHRRKLLQEFPGLETHHPRTILPGPSQPQDNLAPETDLDRVLRQRRTQRIAAQVLQSAAISRRYGDGRMQVEAALMRV
ncbi:MAG TPA: hypothetical protein VEB21_06390 [Terriglobales bacterium]|nr:hypothetical protein [Terriglobales bacterium]